MRTQNTNIYERLMRSLSERMLAIARRLLISYRYSCTVRFFWISKEMRGKEMIRANERIDLMVLFSHFRPRDLVIPKRTVSFKCCPIRVQMLDNL